MARLWVGVDIGKAHHHVAAVDSEGRLVFSRKVDNDAARPFTWKYTTDDLNALLARIAAHERNSPLALAAYPPTN